MEVKVKRSYNRYEEEEQTKLQEVLGLIRAKTISITQASKTYKIPKGTLINKLKNRYSGKIGKPFVFSSEVEKTIVQHILTVSDWGFPFDYSDLAHFVQQIILRQGIHAPQFAENKLPSMRWVRRFVKRHKEISARLCQNFKKSKAAVTPETIKEYFTHLRVTLAEGDEMISADRVYNYDETNLSDDPGVKKCMFRWGNKYAERIRDSSKTSISVMYCGSASGEVLPPYVVYKSENLWQSWMQGGPKSTMYNRSKFRSIIFADWFCNMFVPFCRNKNGRIVLIGDNLSSHFSEEVLKAAEENNISFCCLPKNSTNICQPLDVAFYGPLKRKWRSILDSWKQTLKKKTQTLSKEKFPYLLNELHKHIAPNNHSENLVAGFRKCGICPFNPNEVIDRFPKQVDDELVPTPVVSHVLVDILKEMRYGKQQSETKKRRTKIDVPAGRGITYEDLQNRPGPSGVKNKKNKGKKHVLRDDMDSDAMSMSEEDIRYMDSSPDEDLQTLVRKEQEELELDYSSSEELNNQISRINKSHSLQQTTSSVVSEPTTEITGIVSENVNHAMNETYIIAEFIYNQGSKKEVKKCFVSKIIKEMDNKLQISCMRRYGSKEQPISFVFPPVEDVTEISVDQVKKRLLEPEIFRGRYIFKENLHNMFF